VTVDLRKLKDAPAEYFIIAEGGSNVQVVAIADEVDSYVRTQTHVHPLGIDGRDNAEWIAMDMAQSLFISCSASHVLTTT
jgi:ribosome-associated protein